LGVSVCANAAAVRIANVAAKRKVPPRIEASCFRLRESSR
jgi:hypothetical protein